MGRNRRVLFQLWIMRPLKQRAKERMGAAQLREVSLLWYALWAMCLESFVGSKHISFPMFLVALAFNHARLLDEIDQLLTLLHNYIDEAEGEGRFSCSISSTPIPPSSSSNG